MQKHIKRLVKHPLITGSAVIFTGTLFGSFLSFLFNFVMVKYLTKVDYGTYQSLVSFVNLPAVAISAVIPLLVSFGGEFFAQKDFQKVKGLYLQMTKYFFILGSVFVAILLLFTNQISSFLHIDKVIWLFGAYLYIFLGFIAVVNTAFIQAKLAFNFLTFLTIASSVIKLVLGIILVMIGYTVGGAFGALIAASLVGYLLSFIPLRFLFDRSVHGVKTHIKTLVSYGVPAALALVGLNSLITSDIILAKHFLSADLAGEYSALSLIGRIIFFFTAPIGTVMFPLVVQRYNKQEPFTGILKLSVLIVLAPSLVLTGGYFLFPELLIQIVSKAEYLTIAGYLGYFALFITLYSVATLLVNFYLAIKKTQVYRFTVPFALLQIFGVWFFHQNITVLVSISMISTFLLVLSLLLYYPYATKKK